MPANPEYASFLEQSSLALDAASAEALAANMWLSTLAAGEYLFHQGDPTNTFHVVYQGSVEVRTTSVEGKELVFTALDAGAPIGEATILDGSARTASILARRPAQLLSIDRRPFIALAEQHSGIALSLARLAAETLRRLSTRVEDDTFIDIETRLARLLVELGRVANGVDESNARIEVKVTQQELADRMGVTRESINKYLRGWADVGLVELRRGRVVLPEPRRLLELGP